MKMTKLLQRGRFGVELQRWPSQLKIIHDDKQRAELVDDSTRTGWFFFVFPNLHLDLSEEYRADFEQSLEWYARAMFDVTFQQNDHVDDQALPRTTDPSWSPLVDVEYLSIDGGQALRLVHRMAYEPTREIVMGHLLIPLQQGLFEARVICFDQHTGYRETQLNMQRFQDQPPSSGGDLKRMMASVKQSDFDDSQYDDMFPEHSLSRTRAAIHWICTESELRVTELPSPIEYGEVELPHLGCALVPPLRFVPEPSSDPSLEGGFYRVSFCGTDGIERLRIARWDTDSREAVSNLPNVAASIAREIHKTTNVKDIQIDITELARFNKRPRTLVVVEGNSHMGYLRNAMLFFLDENERVWSLIRFAIEAVPLDTVVKDLDITMHSFRIFDPLKERKAWWRRW